MPLLGGDLFCTRLEQAVLVSLRERLEIPERDLVLAVVALALCRLDEHAGSGHLEADPAQQRLDPAGSEQRVVDVVQIRRREVPVGGGPRLFVGLLENDELELGADVGAEVEIRKPLQLPSEHLPRAGRDLRAVGGHDVGDAERRSLVPRHPPQR